MKIKVNGRDVEITDDIQSYVDKKFNRLSRHLPQMMDATMEIKRTSSRSGDDRIVVQLTLTVKGQVLRAQRRGSTVSEAVDTAVDVMDRPDSTVQGTSLPLQSGTQVPARSAGRHGSGIRRRNAVSGRDGGNDHQGGTPKALPDDRHDRRRRDSGDGAAEPQLLPVPQRGDGYIQRCVPARGWRPTASSNRSRGSASADHAGNYYSRLSGAIQ